MARQKICEICNNEYDVMYRITIDHSKKWVFCCKSCLEKIKSNNEYYRYGGTWKK